MATAKQFLNSQERKAKTAHLAPWQFKKGQSGNPKGRFGGKSLKEYAREYLASLTEEERQEYFNGLAKIDVWKMAEGNPAQGIGADPHLNPVELVVKIIKADASNNENPSGV